MNNKEGEERLELSIEETNALRAKLGLKPLRVNETKSPTINAPPPPASAPADTIIDHEDTKGGGDDSLFFGDTKGLADEDDENTLNWAQKMRGVSGLSAALKAAKLKKKNKMQKAGDKGEEQDLTGMTVAAGVGDIGTDEMVLTLKDESILSVNENNKISGVVKSKDELENLMISEKYKVKEVMKRKNDLAKYKSGHSGDLDREETDRFEPKSFQIGGKLTEVVTEDERSDRITLDTVTKFANDYEEEEPLNVLQLSKPRKHKKSKSKSKKSKKKSNKSKSSLEATVVDELEKTAVKIKKRKRRVRNDESSDEEDNVTIVKRKSYKNASRLAENRSKAAFMRTNEESNEAQSINKSALPDINDGNEEEDDEFLNLALEKARRLKRLKNINKSSQDELVTEEIERSRDNNEAVVTGKSLVFEADSAQDFATTLRNKREIIQNRSVGSKNEKKGLQFTMQKHEEKDVIGDRNKTNSDDDDDVNMEDLAKEMEEERIKDDLNLDENMTRSVGRGLASVLGLLKSTGVVGGAKGGKEELRGRAKDERNYEDYQELDLKKVVKLDTNMNRPDKDIEYANKEVKLEYRDDFGRLLTRKEAFRQLCYQFHGHSSGKKNEERRLKAIEREQASDHTRKETSGVSTIKALKKTQEATGKAYIVHKS